MRPYGHPELKVACDLSTETPYIYGILGGYPSSRTTTFRLICG